MTAKNPDVLIIGAGPAGITAAIQLRRLGLAPVLLEKVAPGGLLWNADRVENYPGFPGGISGPKLAALFEKQLGRMDAAATFGEVARLDYQGSWIAQTKRFEYRPKIVVIASGTKAKPLPLDIPKTVGDRVFSEVRPLAGLKNRHIIIIGAGDAALDQALSLARQNTVTLLNRKSEFRGLPLLRERASKNPRIEVLTETSVVGLESGETANRVRVVGLHDGRPLMRECDFVIFAIGREPQLDFLSDSVKKKNRALVAGGRLFFVGDVHNGAYRQTAIAAGEGLRAAMRIGAGLVIER
jgi:thioredoxin reductase (NADPH)